MNIFSKEFSNYDEKIYFPLHCHHSQELHKSILIDQNAYSFNNLMIKLNHTNNQW